MLGIFGSDDKNENLIALGVSAGEQYKVQRNQAVENEKAYRKIKGLRYSNWLCLLALSAGFIFVITLLIDGLIIRDFLPGRAVKAAVIVRKTTTTIKETDKTWQSYTIFWRQTNSASGLEQSTSVLGEDWINLREGQEITLASGFFYREPLIVGTHKTLPFDLTIKITGLIFFAGVLIYLLHADKTIKNKITQLEKLR